MKNSKSKKPTEKETASEAEEWNLSEGMGILPEDMTLMQNIGCVSGKTRKHNNTTTKSTK